MNFKVYKSSAGSGKTYTLVKEYLSVCLKHPGFFRRILAITFTNKAANEMKQRILQYLYFISNAADYPKEIAVRILLPEIIRDTGLSRENIILNAHKTLKEILHHYADFSVSTIDSFIHRIIRAFAFELKLPANFDVELETNALIDQAVAQLIDEAGREENITRILINYLRYRTGDEKNWNIEREIGRIGIKLMDDNSLSAIEKLKNLSFDDYKNIISQIVKHITIIEEALSKPAVFAIEIIQNNQLEPSDLYQGNRGLYGYFNKLANKDFRNIHPNTYVRNTIDEDKWTTSNAPSAVKQHIEHIKPEILKIYKQIQDTISAKWDFYTVLLQQQKNIYPIALLSELYRIIQQIKKDESLLPIAEFNKKIAEIVLSQPTPFVYERVGEKYHHYLIDEFQDTSVLQWHNLLPLIENTMGQSGTAMIVGDGKQAIYRFRNGELDQFINLPKIQFNIDYPLIKERENVLVQNYQGFSLDKNYRSAKDIVEFNNQFIKDILSYIPEKYQKLYADAMQKPFNSGEGYVSIELMEDDPEYSDHQLERILSIISDVAEKNIAYSQICILCIRNKEAAMIARYLLEHKIPVISSHSLLIAYSSKVNFIISFFYLILNNNNHTSFVSILNFLNNTHNFPQTELHTYRSLLNSSSEKPGLFDEQQALLQTLLKWLKKSGTELNPQKLTEGSLYELCEYLIRTFQLNEEADPYLQFFLDAILTFEEKNLSEINEFLLWWEKNKSTLSIIVPEGYQAVQVMTIHKAKGLEFPVVIFPFASGKIANTKDDCWQSIEEYGIGKLNIGLLDLNKSLIDTKYEKLYAEESEKTLIDKINLLYVAMTRAKEALYIISRKIKHINEPKQLEFFYNVFLAKNNCEDTFDTGNPGAVNKESVKPDQIHDLHFFGSSVWQHKLNLSFQVPESYGLTQDNENLDWGKIVHYFLSLIYTEDDIAKAIFKTKDVYSLENSREKELVNIADRLISHPELKHCFSKNIASKNEAEIISTDNKILRPDKVVFMQKKVLVIDYKTGKPNPAHNKQIKVYANLLRSLGYKNIEGKLIYLETDPLTIKSTI